MEPKIIAISFKMVFVLFFVLLLPNGEAGSLRPSRHHKPSEEWNSQALYNPEASLVAAAGAPGGQPWSADCRTCDTRTCPLVSAETCKGQVVKDRCGCCPFCDTMKPATQLVSTENNTSATCEKIKCPRNKVCLLNIQNIPMCRCPSAYYCRRQQLGQPFRARGESPHLCGRNGKTYKNRCLLQVAECATGRKIRVAHRGKCIGDAQPVKKKGNRKHGSRNPGNSNSQKEDRPMTQVISQYPPNPPEEYANNRDRKLAQGPRRQGEIKRQRNKNKEGRRQRRKERKNRRTKRRYRIYWL